MCYTLVKIGMVNCMKMLKSLIIFVGVIFLLCGCGKSQDELVMVTEAGFAPYEYYKKILQLQG